MTAAVELWGGTVEKFIGDAVMAEVRSPARMVSGSASA